MPPRKKNAVAPTGSNEESRVEVSVDHVSQHIEGSESSEEVGKLSSRALVMAIKDLQRSQVAMWVEVQFLCQRTSTPQTP